LKYDWLSAISKMHFPLLTYINTFPVPLSGECRLLGIDDARAVWIEAYSEQEGVQSCCLSFDGETRHPANSGRSTLQPPALHRPRSAWQTMRLNFAGARHRGERARDLVDQMAHPLTPGERDLLIKTYGIAVPPPLLIGWIESYALAEAQIAPHVFCVCRRLRAAYGLLTPQAESDGTLCNYDSAVIHVAHLYPVDAPIDELIGHLPGAMLLRPLDCQAFDRHLFILDGGSDANAPALHLWQIEAEADLDEDTREQRKLYG
jgi:hypothetical protein